MWNEDDVSRRAALLNLLAIAVGVLCTSTASPEVAGQAADVDRVIGRIDGADGEHAQVWGWLCGFLRSEGVSATAYRRLLGAV
jgi:hypothetical protein